MKPRTPASGPRLMAREALRLTAREAAVLLTVLTLVLPLVGALTITWRLTHRGPKVPVARRDDVAAGTAITETVDRTTEGLVIASPDSGNVMVQCVRRVPGYRSWDCVWLIGEVRTMTMRGGAQ